MMHEKEIEYSIARIAKMEQIFDFAAEILRSTPDELQSPSVKEAVQVLSAYYVCGDWLRDYELDEQGMLPQYLKRGVLSQDGLYDLLTEINEITTK